MPYPQGSNTLTSMAVRISKEVNSVRQRAVVQKGFQQWSGREEKQKEEARTRHSWHSSQYGGSEGDREELWSSVRARDLLWVSR